MSDFMKNLREALEQSRGWLDDAVACAKGGDQEGARENLEDALPWLRTAYTQAGRLTGGSAFSDQLRELWSRLGEMRAPYDVAALEEMRRVLDAGIPEGVSFADEEEDDEPAAVGADAAR